MPKPHILYIVGRPSRMDVKNNRLLAGPAEDFVHDALSQTFPDRADYTLTTCEPTTFLSTLVKTAPSHIIATGDASVRLVAGRDDNLNESRGYVRRYHDIPTVLTFQAQDCCDSRNYDADAFAADDESEDDDASGNAKDHAPTSWKNYRFWFRRDIRKLFATPAALPTLDQRVCTDDVCIRILNSIPAGVRLFFDIETHPPTNVCQCFSFKWPGSPTYSFTVYDYRGNACGNIAGVAAALARAFRRCTVVIHNSSFDLPFLAHYHGLPWGHRVEDTMLMWHRANSEAEKSLGHVISALLNEPFHKGTACFTPHNYAQQQALLYYNAKDVHTLEGVHDALVQLGNATPGLAESMRRVNAAIPVYLLAQFRGFELNMNKRDAHKRALSARVAALTRVLRAMTGLPDLNPNSPKQLIDWLIGGLGYKPHETTDSGEPSMDAKSLYLFRIDYPRNAAITLLLALKKLTKQMQMLGFEPYNVLTHR